MAVYEFFWKVWLRLNLLTKDVDNDYTAEVSTMKNTLRNEDIARRIVVEGSEIKYDTMLSIIKQHDRIISEAVLQGYSVLTDNCQFTPRVSGSWITAKDQFDPARHNVKLDITLSAKMREALAKVGLEILGVKDSGASINKVTDGATGFIDGTITAGDVITIEGDKLRVAGEGEAIGVFFVDSTGANPVKVADRIRRNDPKCVEVKVPDSLTKGAQYTLRIVTSFSSGTTLLKEPRTIEYEKLLTVDGGGGDRPEIE